MLGAVTFVLFISSCTLHVLAQLDTGNSNSTPLQFKYNPTFSNEDTKIYRLDAATIDSAISAQFAEAEQYSKDVDGDLELSDPSKNSLFMVFNSDYSSADVYVLLTTEGVVRVFEKGMTIKDNIITSASLGEAGTLTFGDNKAFLTIAIISHHGLYTAAETPFVFDKLASDSKKYAEVLTEVQKQLFITKDDITYTINPAMAAPVLSKGFISKNYVPAVIFYFSVDDCPFTTDKDQFLLLFTSEFDGSLRYVAFLDNPAITIPNYPMKGTNTKIDEVFGADDSITLGWKWFH